MGNKEVIDNGVITDAQMAIDEFILRDGDRAKKCGCYKCVSEADDRLNWRFNMGRWNRKKLVEKDNRQTLVDDSDCEKEWV